MKIGVEERQKRLGLVGYPDRMKKYLQPLWPSGANLDVTVLVTGQRYFPDPDDGPFVELSLTIHVVSDVSPKSLKGVAKPSARGANPDRLTIIPLGSPVPTNSYMTILAAQYTGHDPPTIPP